METPVMVVFVSVASGTGLEARPITRGHRWKKSPNRTSIEPYRTEPWEKNAPHIMETPVMLVFLAPCPCLPFPLGEARGVEPAR